MLFKKSTPDTPRPARRIVPRKRLHTRAASSRQEVDDYESEAEPSMKLSQAFLVVLALHVIAVGGIYGFNKLKENSAKPVAEKAEPAPPAVSEKAPEPAAAAQPAPVAEATAKTYTVVAGDTLRKIASKFSTSIEALEKANNLTSTSIIRTGQVLVVGKGVPSAVASEPAPVPSTPSVVARPTPAPPVEKPAQPESKPIAKEPSSSGETYVVAKGDNPFSIAKKFKVTQDALMKANNIDDPRKLQIGQKLVIP